MPLMSPHSPLVFSLIPEPELKVNQSMTIQCLLHISNSSTRCSPYKHDLSLEWVGSVPDVHHKWSPCNISTELVLTGNQRGRKVHCRLKNGGEERASAVYTVTFSNPCNVSLPEDGREGNVGRCQLSLRGLNLF